ncbi:MAG: hypothetical protein LH702_02305 [Phormidesmis sp. CAN_BIN44]|nr:hypothetical protein [Phormidesmis sp. CAN_BIN44]
MTTTELRAYLLSHRNDDEAFYKLADRLEASSEESELYPYPDSPEAIAILKAAIQQRVSKLEENHRDKAD